ncbi:MAG TPA: hypothetical protein VKB50_16330 [Vicinamibacterales bacterium]|nr:hypothetical protein [Vicinamibacterales bacterium]
MSGRGRAMRITPLAATGLAVVVFVGLYVVSGFSRTVTTPLLAAQRASQASTPEGQTPPAVPGGGGGRGRGRGGPVGPPPPARQGAPVDLTGNWVSVVTEDWQWRMRTAAKGDTTSVPLNAEGMRVANTWDPSMDGRCEAYGVGGLMRMPGRLKISWQDDNTLKMESDAGQQTRLLRFGPAASIAQGGTPPARTLQGTSVAEWVRGAGAFDAFLERGAGAGSPRWGELKVTTTNILPGWLRRNGVPYSQNASITEYFIRFTNPTAGDWFVVTTVVDDPTYLAQQFVTSSNWKKEPNDSKWNPTPCKSS